MRRAGLLLAVLVLAATAGGIAPSADGTRSLDVLGWEDGFRYDDPVSVTVEDGLNASERRAVTARAMARIERLRGLEFRHDVEVTVLTRSQYQANRSTDRNETHERWNNQVWEALFLVGDDRDVGDVFDDTFGAAVVGYYRPGTGDVVVVSDDENPRLSRTTLVHELVHALQDQHFGLEGTPPTQDRQLARNGVVEGEANRIARQYARRCGGEWDCVDPGGTTSGSDLDGPYERNVYLVIFHPYAVGPAFVERIDERGGQEALDDLYAAYPDSTEQVIHPEAYPGEAPTQVEVPDRSAAGWDRFDHEPVADTAGEASIYATFAANDVGEREGTLYSYRHPASAGWAGDSIVPYRDGDGRYGYVWETAWDSPADAREFAEAYRELLVTRGAGDLGDGRYRIPDAAPFGGAYRLTREGTTVRIVHGPTRDSLDRIHEP